MSDCLFCKIAKGDIAATIVYQDEHTVVFKDIEPQAPVHLLAIPRDHYSGIHEVPPEKHALFQRLFDAVAKTVKEQLLDKKGYRLVVNSGEQAGQAVAHIHVHILSGRSMQWPPG